MAKLPAELIIRMFSYLPIADAWRLRAVSRLWRARLCEDGQVFRAITSTAFRHHEVHHSSDTCYGPSTRLSFRQRARLCMQHQLGKPAVYLERGHRLARPFPDTCRRYSQVLKGHFVAHIEQLGIFSNVYLEDLSTVDIHAMTGGAGPRMLQQVTLTETILGCYDCVSLHIKRLDDLGRLGPPPIQPLMLPIPVRHEGVDAFVGHKHMLAFYLNPDPGSPRTVWLCNSDTLRIDQVHVPWSADVPAHPWPQTLLLDADLQQFVIVTIVYQDYARVDDQIVDVMVEGRTRPMYLLTTHEQMVLVERYNFDGRLVASTSRVYTIQPCPTGPRKTSLAPNICVRPSGYADVWHLSIFHSRLELCFHDILVRIQPGHDLEDLRCLPFASTVWKDTIYRKLPGLVESWPIDNALERNDRWPPPPWWDYYLKSQYSVNECHQLLVNESYLIISAVPISDSWVGAERIRLRDQDELYIRYAFDRTLTGPRNRRLHVGRHRFELIDWKDYGEAAMTVDPKSPRSWFKMHARR